MELNHKIYEIYGEENKPIQIGNAKEVQVLINGEPNGATLHDVFKKIDDLETNKIYGWSILENYKCEDGFLCDSEGKKINLLDGETQIFFRRVKTPLIILNEKEVSLDYIRDVSTLLGLNKIEETITNLPEDDKQTLIEERIALNEKRQKQIQKEKAEADAREKQKLEAERKRLEQEKKEEEERLAKLEEERIESEKAEQEKKEQEEAERKKLEEEAAEQARIQAEEEERTAAEKKKLIEEAKAEARKEFEAELEERRKEEEKRKEDENMFSAKEYRRIRKGYTANGFDQYSTEDEKYNFFFAEELPEGEDPFLVAKRDNNKYEELAGVLAENSERVAEFEFEEEGEEKVIVLNKKTGTIKVEVIE